jgi:tetratricopeptide (TPR) repeat protein
MPQMPNDAEQGAIVKSLIAITEQTKIGAFKSGPVTIAGWTWLALRARTELLGYTQFSGWRADTQSPSSAGGPQGPPTVNPEPDPGPDPIAPQQQSPSGPSADQATCEKGAGDEAIAACTRQIESRDIGRQVLAAAYRSRGDALGRKGDYDRAIADFTEVIRLDPKSTVAYNRRGLAYDRKGNYVLAIADFTEAIRIDPKNAAAYSNRGVAYSRTGEHGRAVADSNEAVLLQKHTRIFNNRSFVFNNMGSYDSALADLDEAIRLDPKYAFAHKNRGISYEKKGEFEKVTRRSISTPRCRKQSRAHDVFARC